MNLVREYREKLMGLLLDRPLSDVEEAARCTELDDLWHRMTDAEQQIVEDGMNQVPSAPSALNLIDQVAASNVPPRLAKTVE